MKKRLWVIAVATALAAGIFGSFAAPAGAADGPDRRPPIEDVRPR